MRNFPYSEISSDKLRDQIIGDIDFLIDGAATKKLKPFILVVGTLFVETGTIQSIMQDLVLDTEECSFEENSKVIIALFKSKRILIYRDCENKSGKFGRDEQRGVDLYFDPDEPYLSLICIDTNKSGGNTDLKTADNYPYYKIKFKPEEVLVEFDIDKYN
jgi:hypothetical protein